MPSHLIWPTLTLIVASAASIPAMSDERSRPFVYSFLIPTLIAGAAVVCSQLRMF